MISESNAGLESFQRKSTSNQLIYEELQARGRMALEPLSNEAELAEILERSKLPKRHLSLKTTHGRFWQAVEARLLLSIRTGFLTVLLGPRGVGKTQLAVSIALAVARSGRQPVYRTVSELLHEMSYRFCDEQRISEKTAMNRFLKPALLIIDEMQLRSETAAQEATLTELIDARYKDKKDTLLISNLSVADFNTLMGASVCSRINETGEVFVCNWESYR